MTEKSSGGSRPPVDFVIAGETKCGTTSLAFNLHDHPDLHVSTTRPVRFFDRHWDQGLQWYRDCFADAPEGALWGDDTPNYLFDPVAIDRLADTAPEARIIVSLREPIARSWSHYWHSDRSGFDRRGYEAAVDHELRYGLGAADTPEGSGYLARGRYDDTLAHVLSRFDRDRVLVLFFDDVVADPVGSVQRVHRFLGVAPAAVPQADVVFNVGWRPRRRRILAAIYALRLDRLPLGIGRRLTMANVEWSAAPQISPGLRARLDDYYAPHLAGLRVLLGDVDVPPWLASA